MRNTKTVQLFVAALAVTAFPTHITIDTAAVPKTDSSTENGLTLGSTSRRPPLGEQSHIIVMDERTDSTRRLSAGGSVAAQSLVATKAAGAASPLGRNTEDTLADPPANSPADTPAAWAAYLEASATLHGKPPIRWLHVPKAGSSFWYSFTAYACEPAYVKDHPYLDGFIYFTSTGAYKRDPTGGRGYTAGPGTICPRALVPMESGHVPMGVKELGVTVGMFRHPRSRMASHCRKTVAKRSLPDDTATNVEVKNEYMKCIEAHAKHNHLGVMTRMVAGETCGGAIGCNSLSTLEALPEQVVVKALDRIAKGALLFVGITEDWNDSIDLFHAMVMPKVPVFSVELQNMHPSTKRDASTDLMRQENSFARMDLSTRYRNMLEHDPDHIIYARIRQIFCLNYWTHVAAPRCPSMSDEAKLMCIASKLPSKCHGDLGPLPASPENDKRMLAAAEAVIKRWGLQGREDVSAEIVSGAGISIQAMFQSAPEKFMPMASGQHHIRARENRFEHGTEAPPGRRPPERDQPGSAMFQSAPEKLMPMASGQHHIRARENQFEHGTEAPPGRRPPERDQHGSA